MMNYGGVLHCGKGPEGYLTSAYYVNMRVRVRDGDTAPSLLAALWPHFLRGGSRNTAAVCGSVAATRKQTWQMCTTLNKHVPNTISRVTGALSSAAFPVILQLWFSTRMEQLSCESLSAFSQIHLNKLALNKRKTRS